MRRGLTLCEHPSESQICGIKHGHQLRLAYCGIKSCHTIMYLFGRSDEVSVDEMQGGPLLKEVQSMQQRGGLGNPHAGERHDRTQCFRYFLAWAFVKRA